MYKPRTHKSSFAGRNSSFRSRGSNRTFSPRKYGPSTAKIDINAFIEANQKQALEPVAPSVITHKFTDFGFGPIINRNLASKGYSIPTEIQDQAIEPIMAGRDLIGLANTGTGKTAAYLLPLIDKVSKDHTQKVLVVAPTRELAQQIEAELRTFSQGIQISAVTCVGGLPIHRQISQLKRTCDIVIGTPGRINDLAKRGYIVFENYNNIVLDEVDRMLDMGFVKEITYFLSKLPQKRQSLFFSATMPEKIASLTRGFANDPVTVKVTTKISANVEQMVVKSARSDKLEKLHEILALPEMEKVIIFSETKRDVRKLTVALRDKGFRAESIHGDKAQAQRQRALRDFKEEHIKILVATDVAARGLDIKDVSHVINYTVPKTYDDYVHRIGRTGRAGMTGKALTFVE